jgi:hypothetical protein
MWFFLVKHQQQQQKLSFFLYHVYHIERLDESAASLLHCTCPAFLGHTQTLARARVDLRVAPLLL